MAKPWEEYQQQPSAGPWDEYATQQPVAPAPVEVPLSERLQRQAGLTGRAVANVVASPVGIAGNALNKSINALIGTNLPMPSDAIDRGLDKVFPTPANGVEEFTQSMAKSAPAVALPAALMPQVLGNAAIGAAQAPRGEEASGAGWGAGSGAFGHALGRTMAGLVKPTPAAQELINRDVALSVGQAGKGGDWLSNTISRGEEALTSNPVSGAPLRAAQRRGIEEANRAAAQAVVKQVDEAKKLGMPPREAIAQTRDAISTAYDDALTGWSAKIGDVEQGLKHSLYNIAENHPMLDASDLTKMEKFINGRFAVAKQQGMSELTGEQMKLLDSELGSYIRKLKASTNAADKVAGSAWADLQGELRNTMAINAQHAKATQLNAANAAYRQLLALEKAMQPGADTFSPRQLAATLQRMEIEGAELNNVAKAMQQTLPNTIPNSGTADRLITNLLPSMLVGGGYGANELGYGTLGTGLMAAGLMGTRGGTRAMTGSLPGQQFVAEALRRYTPTVVRSTQNRSKKNGK